MGQYQGCGAGAGAAGADTFWSEPEPEPPKTVCSLNESNLNQLRHNLQPWSHDINFLNMSLKLTLHKKGIQMFVFQPIFMENLLKGQYLLDKMQNLGN